MKFHTYSDPGHGWAKVPKSYVYLEEDCDLPAFIDAMAAANKPVEFINHTSRIKMSKIRSYNSYQNYTTEELNLKQSLLDSLLNSRQMWSKSAITTLKNGSLSDMKYWSDLYLGTKLWSIGGN